MRTEGAVRSWVYTVRDGEQQEKGSMLSSASVTPCVSKDKGSRRDPSPRVMPHGARSSLHPVQGPGCRSAALLGCAEDAPQARSEPRGELCC